MPFLWRTPLSVAVMLWGVTMTAWAASPAKPAGQTAVKAGAEPVFPYGAVYFRKSNPPAEEWVRDHQTAAKVGMNTFRHWFMWSAIEVEPGRYDWRDYDRMLDLEAENKIRTVIAPPDHAVPEWAFERYRHARYLASDGEVTGSGISASSATGDWPTMAT